MNPWPDAPIVRKERTLSTMDDARELARGGCPTGTVVVAGFQEKGRGRVPGRTWVSPPWESLLATVVLRKTDLAFALPELPLRAGVAAARAVEDAAGVRPQIKWPNDLVLEGRKLAGLLCEARGDSVLVGIGVNCAQEAFPDELAAIACSLFQATGRALSPADLLAPMLSRLREALSDDTWRDALLARLYKRGELVRVDLPGSDRFVEGILRTVDAEGALVIEVPGGEMLPVAQGEISLAP